MKGLLLGAALAACLSTSAFAQSVCGFTMRAANDGSDSFAISGPVCNSMEAAIAVAYYQATEGFSPRESVNYVNGRRHDQSCFMASGGTARKISTEVKHDQDNDALVVQIWEFKSPTLVRTLISAHYRDWC